MDRPSHETNEINELIKDFRDESDRSTVIVGAAKIDSLLYLLLRKFFRPISSNQDELLDGDSPLSTFSSRIHVCYRLGLIDGEFAKCLNLVRKIRNSFAHELKGVSLNTSHSDRIRELLHHFVKYQGYHDFKEKHISDKVGFDMHFRAILIILILRLQGAVDRAETIKGDDLNLIPPKWEKPQDESEMTS